MDPDLTTTASASSLSSAMRIGVNINETDIVKLILEFLSNRDLHISMLDLERESGVINAHYSDDLLFLRQLLLDGQWDDALAFVQPLTQSPAFDNRLFHFTVMKHQYLELLCLRSEASTPDHQLSAEQLVAYLADLRPHCPTEDHYQRLCLLLTAPRLQDLAEFKAWNPASGRLACFREILPLVFKFLPADQTKSNPATANNERLVQLVVKGLLYESCVEYCQARATSSTDSYNLADPSALLQHLQLAETDASLLSWLHALPLDTFSCPFEEKPLKLGLAKLAKPSLEATWADAILATPIKPQELFPYNAVPSGRSRNAELMSRSLAPQYDGLSFGLNRSQIFTSGTGMQLNPSSTPQEPTPSKNFPNKKSTQNGGNVYQRDLNEMTKSIALFNLEMPENTRQKQPQLPLPQPSQQSPMTSSFMSRVHPVVLNGIEEEAEKEAEAEMPANGRMMRASNPMHDSTLFKEYQKNRMQIVQQLEEQEKKRDELVKQLKSPNVHNALSAISNSRNGSQAKPDINNDDSVISPKLHRKHNANTSQINNDSFLPNNGKPSSPSTSSTSSPPSAQSPVMYDHPKQTTKTRPVPAAKPSNTRPIHEVTKFDSLEDITRAVSFQAVTTIEDQQAIRAVDIHPSGNFYVVGSNSKCLRVLPYPSLDNVKPDNQPKAAQVLYKKAKHHYGSIYCTAWNPSGNLIATGSNDKTIKLIKFDPDLMEDNDSEMELTYHNGTVRDLVFMHQHDNDLLVSGGAGDCRINVLDCHTQQTLRSYSGHAGHIYTLYTWPGTQNVFVSGSQDKSVRFWDLRSPEAIQVVTPSTTIALQGSPVAGLAVDPSGLLMASGHEDAACCLYDIRGARIVQIYKPHSSDIRSIRFSTNAYYLLTASYDNKVIITDLHGDLTKPLSWSVVAQHNDKIIQAKWHPSQMSFVTTSADRTSTVWSLPTSALASASVL